MTNISNIIPKLRWPRPPANDSAFEKDASVVSLSDKARAVSRSLTYNEDAAQASAKHLLLEMASKLDAMEIRVHRKSDGYMIVNAAGRSRYMTLRERFLYNLFGVVPHRV